MTEPLCLLLLLRPVCDRATLFGLFVVGIVFQSQFVLYGWFATGGVLKRGTQPADETSFLFLGPFVIESDQMFEDLFIGQIVRPAVGVKHRRVELVVDLLQHTAVPFS